jgi:hypothetical protein
MTDKKDISISRMKAEGFTVKSTMKNSVVSRVIQSGILYTYRDTYIVPDNV